jgi:hypothetical protein
MVVETAARSIPRSFGSTETAQERQRQRHAVPLSRERIVVRHGVVEGHAASNRPAGCFGGPGSGERRGGIVARVPTLLDSTSVRRGAVEEQTSAVGILVVSAVKGRWCWWVSRVGGSRFAANPRFAEVRR